MRVLWWSLTPRSRSDPASPPPAVSSEYEPSVSGLEPVAYRPIVDAVSLARAAERGGVWRLLDQETGNPLVVCPNCWSDVVIALLRTRVSVVAQVLGVRPEWARCGVCDPDDAS